MGALGTVKAQGEMLQVSVANNLRLAQDVVRRSGGLSLKSDAITWNAVDQFSKQTTSVKLPVLGIGGKPLGRNQNPNVKTPVVDDANALSPGAYTIFQRMNERGDMLRVATNVLSKDGASRGTGTYIPATNPDGNANPIVSAVLNGRGYEGVAFVVDQWYVTAYEPYRDSSGKVIGMLFAGERQQKIPSLRNAIAGATVGKTGLMYVLGGKGDKEGKYLIPPKGQEDNASALELKDAAGKDYVKNLIEKAVALKDNETGSLAVRMKGADGQVESRLLSFAYYEPWDWIIVAEAPASDFAKATQQLEAGRKRMVWALWIAGLMVALVGAGAATSMAKRWTEPIVRVDSVMQELASGDGDLTIRLEAQGMDEVGSLSRSFNEFADKLEGIVTDLLRASGETAADAQEIARVGGVASSSGEHSAKSVEELAQQGNLVAEALRKASEGANQLQEAVESVAKGSNEQALRLDTSAKAIDAMAAQLSEVARGAEEANAAAGDARRAADEGTLSVQASIEGMERIASATSAASQRVGELGQASNQINDIVQAIQGIAEQTNLLALNAAIEAARAGEHGRGFAVVAEEVRKLAENSAAQTRNVAELILNIQQLTDQAMVAMETGSKEVQEGQGLVAQAGKALHQIQSDAAAAGERIAGVSAATETINEAAESVQGEIDNLAALTEETSAAAQQMAAACDEVVHEVHRAGEAGEEQSRLLHVASDAAEQTMDASERLKTASGKLTAAAQRAAGLVSQFRVSQRERSEGPAPSQTRAA